MSVHSKVEVRIYEELGGVRITTTRRDWLQIAVGPTGFESRIVLTHDQARLLASKLAEVCDQWEAELTRWKREEPEVGE